MIPYARATGSLMAGVQAGMNVRSDRLVDWSDW
jgi:hypothetical protein